MPSLNDEIFDQGLDYADTFASGSPQVDILSADPGLTWSNISGTTLGNKTGASIGATADAATGTGRRVTLAAITDGSVTGNGTATHWAIHDNSAIISASGALSGGGQTVSSGNTWTLDAIDLIIRDPV